MPRPAVHTMQHQLREVHRSREALERAEDRYVEKALRLCSELKVWRRSKSTIEVATAIGVTPEWFEAMESGQSGLLVFLDETMMRKWYHAIGLPYVDEQWMTGK